MKFKRISRILIILGMFLVLTPALGASTANWSTPENLSDWQISANEPWLLRGDDGTQVVFWSQTDTFLKQESLWARVRPPGGEWSTAHNIFGWIDYSSFFPEVDVAPDGTVWVMWAMPDHSQFGDNMQVKAASWTGSGPWQLEVLSDYENDIRNIDLYTGPDNHLAATWVACSSSGANDQGPCDVRLRRRNPGAIAWELRDESVDATISGILYGRSLVGPGGMIVTTWAESSQSTAGQWHVMANTFDPNTKTWDSPPKDISAGEVRSNVWPFLSEPVMGTDGTVIIAWYQQDAADLNKADLYSTTRQASTKTWNLPVPLSNVHTASVMIPPKLAVGQNGTAVAAWEQKKSISVMEYAVFANVRDPGGTWSSNPVQVSIWFDGIDLALPQVWPDGSSMLVWEASDSSRDSNENESLFWSARPPHGTWGDMGMGQLGSWFNSIDGVSLAAADDGSITVVWGINDFSRPIDQRGEALVANWIPGPGTISIEMLTSGYKSVNVNRAGVAVSRDGQTKAAAWLTRKDAAHMTDPNRGVFYSQVNTAQAIYLPLVRQR